MSFSILFSAPYSEATSFILDTTVWDVSIDDLPFQLDTASDAFAQGMQSIKAIREQSDNSALPGEQSITREELWRASMSSWHKGAGQRYRDKPESDPERFWSSLNMDVWTKNQLTPLNGTAWNFPTTNPSPLAITAGGYVYFYGDTLQRYDGGNVATVTGVSGTVTSMATDGHTIWVLTTAGSYIGTNASLAFSAWSLTAPGSLTTATTGPYEKVAFVNNRLLVTIKQFICEVTGTATVAQLNPDEGNSDWRWTSLTDGTSAIYAAGYSGHRSQIFSIRPPADTPDGALSTPIPAAPSLPTGEIVRSLYTYLGLTCIGTDRGFRVASKLTDYAGREILSIGPLTELSSPVLCFDGEGSYVWFGWTNFDSTHTGLGRINLAQQTDPGVYAYATDLQRSGQQGAITSICTLNSTRYWSIAGVGLGLELRASKAPIAWVQSGIIRYELIDTKIAERVEVRHSATRGSVNLSLSKDFGDFTNLGTQTCNVGVSPVLKYDADEIAGTDFELTVTINSDFHGTAYGPVVNHVELRSAVVPDRGVTFLVPLILTTDNSQFGPARHPADDFEYLVQLSRYKHSATYRERSKVFNVIVQDFQFIRGQATEDNRWWNGTMVLRLMAPSK